MIGLKPYKMLTVLLSPEMPGDKTSTAGRTLKKQYDPKQSEIEIQGSIAE